MALPPSAQQALLNCIEKDEDVTPIALKNGLDQATVEAWFGCAFQHISNHKSELESDKKYAAIGLEIADEYHDMETSTLSLLEENLEFQEKHAESLQAGREQREARIVELDGEIRAQKKVCAEAKNNILRQKAKGEASSLRTVARNEMRNILKREQDLQRRTEKVQHDINMALPPSAQQALLNCIEKDEDVTPIAIKYGVDQATVEALFCAFQDISNLKSELETEKKYAVIGLEDADDYHDMETMTLSLLEGNLEFHEKHAEYLQAEKEQCEARLVKSDGEIRAQKEVCAEAKNDILRQKATGEASSGRTAARNKMRIIRKREQDLQRWTEKFQRAFARYMKSQKPELAITDHLDTVEDKEQVPVAARDGKAYGRGLSAGKEVAAVAKNRKIIDHDVPTVVPATEKPATISTPTTKGCSPRANEGRSVRRTVRKSIRPDRYGY